MNELSVVCLSLTPNLRCFGFEHWQFGLLVIPPAVEFIISVSFVFLHPGPGRVAQIFLAADGILYFVWALLDMLSHVVPTVQNSLLVFKVLDIIIGAASFTPILLYSVYLYLLSFGDFIPILPRKLQPYLTISLPILLVAAVAINEVSSFVGTHLGSASNSQGVEFLHDNRYLWLTLSRFSLAVFTFTQFLFFLLSFFRLSRAFLNQRRIKLSHSDEHHFFHGIAWITAGIVIGVIETAAGFVRTSFTVAITRRILRLAARVIFMFGLHKGLDVAENFENLTDELRGASRINKRISHMLGVNSKRMSTFRRISPSLASERSQSRVDEGEHSPVEEQPRNPRVTVHYKTGQAPLLQIRFSKLDLPIQGLVADVDQQRRRSLSGLILGQANAGSCMQQDEGNVSNEMAAARNAILETPRAKSALVPTSSGHYVPPDWLRRPETSHTRQGSEATAISDNLSIIRDLECRFPSLPPRVTGRYRGSILGQNCEEDPFPVVGVSRQSSVRQGGGDAHNPAEEGGTSVTLSPSNSIKRKPAPPLLQNLAYISSRVRRPASTWIQDAGDYPMDSPVLPDSPLEGNTSYNLSPVAGPSTPGSRRSARNILIRASRALSDASIRSAEWFASASSARSAPTILTPTDIEMYRDGNKGFGSARPASIEGGASLSGEALLPKASRKTQSSSPHVVTPINVGSAPMRITPTPTHADLESGHERISSSHGSVNLLGGTQLKAGQQR